MGKEAIQFRCTLLYRGDSSSNIKFGIVAPVGASVSFSPVGSIKISAGDIISISPTVFSTATAISYGAATGNGTRSAEIVGEIKTNGTSGDFKVQFAQNSADASSTQVLAQSFLEVIRH